MNPSDFGDIVTFPPASTGGRQFWVRVKYLNNCWTVLMMLGFPLKNEMCNVKYLYSYKTDWHKYICKHIPVPQRIYPDDFVDNIYFGL